MLTSSFTVVVMFQRFGPYHYARLDASARHGNIIALEFSSVDNIYAWNAVRHASACRCLVLFEGVDIDSQAPAMVDIRMSIALSELQPDVVAIPGWSSKGALAALRWANRKGVPAILMADSMASAENNRTWKDGVKRRLMKLYSAALVAGAPHVDYLRFLGMPCERIFSGYDVVDNTYFTAGADAVRQSASVLRSVAQLPEHYFLITCRFIWEKNLLNLLRAYASYQRAAGADAWQLVILGDGPLRDEVIKLSEELHISAALKLVGFQQYEHLPTYYGLASALILPSVSETWGLVVNEAMASGLPVIVSKRCGCAPDLVEEGRNGFTFDPYDVDALADCMLRMADPATDRAAMGRASQEIIACWSPEFFAENLQKAAEAALTAPKRKFGLLDRALLSALRWR